MAVSPTNWLGVFGRPAVRAGTYITDLTVFTGRALTDPARRRGLLNPASRRAVVTQLLFTGVDALPAIALLALAVGVGGVAQLILALQELGTESEVVTIIADWIALEIGPLLTAVLLIGRSGSAITVDLLQTKFNRELEAIELLGININDFFVVPRLWGCAVAQLALAVLLSSLTVISAIIATAVWAPIDVGQYLQAITVAFTPYEIVLFVLKNLLFGLSIAAVACFHGLQIRGSATEVPQQTQQAIVAALLIVFVLDGVFAVGLG